MPFSGPDGQGPFDSFSQCVDAMEDEPGVDDPEGLCAYWEDLDKTNANTMTQPDDQNDVPNRAHHHASGEHVTLREVDDQSDEGLMTIRMPIASTGEVRNEGDEPLTRDELDGMARQINDGDVGVFLAHGDSLEITDARYGQTERLGNWEDATVTDDRAEADETFLMADARMPDPETLPDGVARYREALGILKEQAQRGIGMSASIGWREDDDAAGGNDLMEASIVGIPADPRTATQDSPAIAVARAAVDAGADPDALVDAVREAVTGDADATSDPADTDQHEAMTDDEAPESDAENEAADTDGSDESDERQEAPEWAERMLELQQETNDTLQSVADAVREDDEMDDEDEDEDDDEEENDAAAEAAQDATDEVDDLRDAVDTLREGGIDVTDVEMPDETDDDSDSRDTDAAASDDTDDHPDPQDVWGPM